MSTALHRVRRCLLPVTLSVLSLALIAAGFVFCAGSAAAQTADTDADSYADDLERQLASNPNDPESTPETFAMLWTCTDGNDNDRDGMRDFIDPGCRNTVPGSTPAPNSNGAPSGPADSGAASGEGTAGSGGAASPGGGSSPGGSSGAGGAGSGNAVLEGSGSSVGGTSRAGAGTDNASQTGSSSGQNSGDSTGANSDKSADAGLAPGTGSGTDTSQSDAAGDDGGFPWKTFLLLLALILIAGLIGFALLAARSRRLRARSRY